MQSKQLDAEGMAALTRECPGLWHDFAANFCRSNNHAAIRPLHDLTEWHTCLLIRAGVVSGLVDNGKRCLLIKGRTTKAKVIKVRENEDSNVLSEEQRDRFTTVIKAIDMTPGSPHYGSIIQINNGFCRPFPAGSYPLRGLLPSFINPMSGVTYD